METSDETGRKNDGWTRGTEKRSDNEDLTGRTERLRESLRLLQEVAPDLLQGLENSRRDRLPAVLHVEGYEHSSEIALALLRCAYAYGVTLTVVPYPVQTLNDAPPITFLNPLDCS